MIIKIARGGSKEMSPQPSPIRGGGWGDRFCTDSVTLCPWMMFSPNSDFGFGGDIFPIECGDTNSPRGFGIVGTVVSVPSDADPGYYEVSFQSGDFENQVLSVYAFEVVCMTVELEVRLLSTQGDDRSCRTW